MTPEHAKRLLNALMDNVTKYESQFGLINLGGGQAQQGGTFNLGDLPQFGPNGAKSYLEMTDFKNIKAFTFDIDGVMTDGGILADLEGQLYRTFDAKDGFAVRMACLNGFPVGVITGGRSQSIRARFSSNGINPEDIYLGSRNKIEDFEDFCRRHNLKPEEVMYFGDDIPDIEVIRAAGIGVCPNDAVEEVKEAADIISDRPGGKACVREYMEKAMKAQGRWVFDAIAYKKKF